MKPTGRFDSRRAARGFTLIEMLVAIAILAVVAVLAWRGLDQVMRGRETIQDAMADERAMAQLFDQMRVDARQAATDDEVGQAAIAFAGGGLQIVRNFIPPGGAPRLQVVRYRLVAGRVVRYASPPLATRNALRSALAAPDRANGWSAVDLLAGITDMSAQFWIPEAGWTDRMSDVAQAITHNAHELLVPQLGNAPLQRAVTGLTVQVRGVSLHVPLTRVFMVGQ